ncbi:M48 family metallopeptidase [Paraburkholderia sp. MMS20-SJTN17]|uniref:M48 family metallopeptidase n=1 Tax=Paraburkholderia translucens TaxID=2886945 RepID=A0ABS8KB10_9BURK|nr:M48 family metallopeptidase [Paraburkholderia sp. MMS20-SJTN17]MCC8401958.1 M48 family metallopeptidase [Paraburkholderia sp. MMS20-SJTN17]
MKVRFSTGARCTALGAAWWLGCASVALAMPSGAYAAGAAATGAASAENATSAAPGASLGTNDGKAAGANAGAPSTTAASGGAPGPAPSSPAQQSAQPAATAKAPATAAAPAAVPPPYYVSPQLRYGGYMVFRNLIPSPMLETQAAEEFSQIVYGASHAKRLYGDTDARVTRVRSIIDRMIPYSLKWNERAKGWKWEVAVVRSNDIRMYCLPGGKIVVYSGIIDRVRLNDNELAMLIGHEIAHALREHARMRLGQLQASQLDSTGTIPQLFGLADLGMAPLGIGSRLLEMKYEDTDETEADVIGSDIASRAGFDPRAAVTLWDKLAQATRGNGERGFIYVHPYPQARREDIIKRLPDMLPLYAKAIGKSVDALPDYAGIGRPTRTPVRD